MLTLFHDHASPASAVAVLRLGVLLDEGVDLRFVGYQPLPLEAPIPPTLEVLEQLERHADDAAAIGVTLVKPRRLPVTTGAHHLEALAAAAGSARQVRDTCYRALWERSRDISDVDVLVDIAAAAGIDADATRAALTDRAARSAVKARLSEPRSVHVGGVPALDFDGTLVSAFLPLDDLRALAHL